MAQYQIGTCSVTQGSKTVVGQGTAWKSALAAGNWFEIRAEGIWYDIASIDSDTQLTLATPYLAASKIKQAYVVQRDFTPYVGYPLSSYGDVDTGSLLGYALTAIDLQLAQIQPNLTGFTNGNIQASGPMNFSGLVDGDLDVAGQVGLRAVSNGDLEIEGQLTLSGENLVLEPQTLSCMDAVMTVASTNFNATANYSGIVVERGGNQAMMLWSEQIKRWGVYTGTAAAPVLGDIVAANFYGALASPSDARLKIVRGAISDPLWRVSQLNGVEFFWNEKAAELGRTGKDVGLIAQDVQLVLPEAVSPNGETMFVDYAKVVPLLVEAVKELAAQNKALADRIHAIEALAKSSIP